jgi:hypothetical protein
MRRFEVKRRGPNESRSGQSRRPPLPRCSGCKLGHNQLKILSITPSEDCRSCSYRCAFAGTAACLTA